MDEVELKHHLSGIARVTVEETLNAMLDAEADALCRMVTTKWGTTRYLRMEKAVE